MSQLPRWRLDRMPETQEELAEFNAAMAEQARLAEIERRRAYYAELQRQQEPTPPPLPPRLPQNAYEEAQVTQALLRVIPKVDNRAIIEADARPAAPSRLSADLQSPWIPACAALLCGVLGVYVLQFERPIPYCSYPLIALFPGWLAYRIAGYWARIPQIRWLAAICSVALIWFAVGWFHTWEEIRRRESDGAIELITRQFWTNKPLRITRNGDGWVYQSELCDSGKAHGKVRYICWKKGEEVDETAWFWYGEPITEGEWHLRNK